MSGEQASAEANTTDATAQKRSTLQQLYARGLITLDDYEALGRLHGFISPEKKTLPQLLGPFASYTGYALLILGALVEIAGRENPELRGPLTQGLELLKIIAQGLGLPL